MGIKEIVIKVDKLCFAYRKSPILENASFSVRQGESIAIIGPKPRTSPMMACFS